MREYQLSKVMQEGMRLSGEQEAEILKSYRWMHLGMCRLAEERNTVILPQLHFEALTVDQVPPIIILLVMPHQLAEGGTLHIA